MRLLAASKGQLANVVPKHKFGGGRRRKTFVATHVLMKRELKKNPLLTASELNNLHPNLLKNVNVRTIRHRLQEDLGLPCRRAAKKPFINDRIRKDRLVFAKKYEGWTLAQWRKVMSSDESNFQVFRMGSNLVRRPRSSNRYDPIYTRPTVKHPDSVMVWGAYSGENGRADL